MKSGEVRLRNICKSDYVRSLRGMVSDFIGSQGRVELKFWDDSNVAAAARATTVVGLLLALTAGAVAVKVLKPAGDGARPAALARHKRPSSAPASAQPLAMLASFGPDEGLALDSDFDAGAAGALYRRLLGKVGEDRPGRLRFGQAQVQRSIVERVVSAARTAGADPALMMSIADKESSFAPAAKASTSSASGLFQFIDTTWLRAIRDFGERYGLGEHAKAIAGDEARPNVAEKKRAETLNLRNDPYLAAAMAAEMLKHDGAKIAELVGRPLSAGETYLLHFLGPDDAARFMAKLDAEPEASAAQLLPKPARANKPIFYERQGGRLKERSLSEVHEAFENMMGTRLARFGDVEERLPQGVSAYAPSER
ncbi:MAG TPA: transglycosylase SLT domain-containing protein [Methylocystis sp.]|nr:transglycosylase SLT domain-containing protein [Methylocystis sp.]